MTWRSTWRAGLGAAVLLTAAVYAAILVVDPYDAVAVSPALDRQPIARDQRYSAPALARKARYDSAILGTSTTRLMQPALLDGAFGAAFVNLSVDNALPFEQDRLLAVFLRHHVRPKIVLIGLDHTMWCREHDQDPQKLRRKLPDTLYDDDRWNDLAHLLSRRVLVHAWEEFVYLAGLGPQKWGKDGYTAWLPPERYDPARARRYLYGPPGAPPDPELDRAADDLPADRASWRFVHIEWHARMLERMPPETMKIVVVMPTHRIAHGRPGGRVALRLAECKRRLFAIDARYPNVATLDFAFDSDITRHDGNYWDQVHLTAEAAVRFQRLIAEGVRGRRSERDLFEYVDLRRYGN
ncbi:MAG: hypothetical protein L6R19_09490 [Alphaproteobacteria bacterium]|nr:hypothetical protein [Alphaproteobacteria bacterium]